MELILWRHAEAADDTPDHTRELTARGVRQAEKVAAFLRPLLPHDVRILASPAARTRQTVAALTEHYTLAPAIASGATAHAVLRSARWPEASGTVLVVGHQPTLGAVAAHLLGSSEYSLSIRKGAVWWFSRREHDGSAQITLRLVMSPEFL